MEHVRRRYDPHILENPSAAPGQGPHTEGVVEGIQRIQAIATLVESVLVWRAQFIARTVGLDEAEVLLHRMIFREGCENPQAMELLGRILFQKGKYAEAAGLFRRSMILQPGNPTIKRSLALAERATKGAGVVLLKYRLRFLATLLGCLVLVVGAGWGLNRTWRALERFAEGPAPEGAPADFRYDESVARVPFEIAGGFGPAEEPGEEDAPLSGEGSSLSFLRRKMGSGATLGRLTVWVDRAGSTVRASGKVPSLYVRYLVERELWKLPGVRNVDLQRLEVERSYRVRRGENLWLIARHLYGDGRSWGVLSEFNTLKRPDRLQVGQVLAIPLGNEELIPLP